VDEASRNDLVVGDQVTVQSLDAATTYAWTLVFAPQGSTATFTGSTSAVSPGHFTVDVEGAYLIRLVVDATLPTEDSQYVRLRFLTIFGQLHLVAAGERRDGTGIIPVDIDPEGWANEQNANLVVLKDFIKPIASSGRVFYVDATTGYADYNTIQDALVAASSLTPTAVAPWLILVRPGTYVEDLTLIPWVHLVGWPGNLDGQTSKAVVVEGLHTSTSTLSSQQTLLSNLHLENNADSALPTLAKSGAGTLKVYNCRVESNGVSLTQGPAVDLLAGTIEAEGSTFLHNIAGVATGWAFQQDAASTSMLRNCTLSGPSGIRINDGVGAAIQSQMEGCRIQSYHTSGVALSTRALSTEVLWCKILSAGTTGVHVGRPATVWSGDVSTALKYTDVSGDVIYDTTNLTGSNTLGLGSVGYANLTFPSTAPSITATTKATTLDYDPSSSGLDATHVQAAIDRLGVLTPLVYHKEMAALAGGTVTYRGWVPQACTLTAVRVYMQGVNTVGAYTATVTNIGVGASVLTAATFDMNTLTPATVTTLGLSATPTDLEFSASGLWTFSLTSDSAGFDGSEIFFELVFALVR